MVRCEVIEKFTLGNDKRFKFEDLQEIKRKDVNKNDYGTLYVGDEFLCNDEMALYLGGVNPLKKVVIKIPPIEIIPSKEEIADIIETNQDKLVEDVDEGIKKAIKEMKKTTRGRKKKSDE